MSGRDRLPFFPSRANLVFIKQRVSAASKGLRLLKRKRDALEGRLRELTAELKAIKKVVDIAMHEAYFALARAKYLRTDLKPVAMLNSDYADVHLLIKKVKVVGLVFPSFELMMETPKSLPLTGLSAGGSQVQIVREMFQEAIKLLTQLASLNLGIKVLQEGARQNNMRVNGLESVVVPRFINTINYIVDELDEYEREDFYRLKRSRAKQKRNKEIFTKLVQSRTQRSSGMASEKEENKAVAYQRSAFTEEFNMNEFEKDYYKKITKKEKSQISVEDVEYSDSAELAAFSPANTAYEIQTVKFEDDVKEEPAIKSNNSQLSIETNSRRESQVSNESANATAQNQTNESTTQEAKDI